VPLDDEILDRHRPVVALVAAAALLLLLVACELAVRAAVGASRERLVRQLLVEGLLLSLLAAAAGLPLARATLGGARRAGWTFQPQDATGITSMDAVFREGTDAHAHSYARSLQDLYLIELARR
jgi:hypothetical protein